MLKFFGLSLVFSVSCWAGPLRLTLGYFSINGSEVATLSRAGDSVVLEFENPVTVDIDNELRIIERVRAADPGTGVILEELAVRSTSDVVLRRLSLNVLNMLAYEYFEITGEKAPHHALVREVQREYPMSISEVFLSNLNVGGSKELLTSGEPSIRLRAVLTPEGGHTLFSEDHSYLPVKGEIWKLPHLPLVDPRVQQLIEERRAELVQIEKHSTKHHHGFRDAGDLPFSAFCAAALVGSE